MRLKYQILLTLLVSSAVLIAIMYALSSWSFSRGFLEYVNQNEAESLSETSDELVYLYDQSGDWSFVQQDTLQVLAQSRAGRGSQNLPRRGPPPPRGERNANTETNTSASNTERQNNGRGRNRRSPNLVLLDANREWLAGPKFQEADFNWIDLVSSGTTDAVTSVESQAVNGNQTQVDALSSAVIGYLGYRKITGVDRHFDQVFQSKQKKDISLTALSMIVLSALLSIPLASFIVRPLLKVNSAVNEISSGNFSHRIEHKRTDELGDLANNINGLSLSLQKNQDARQRWIAEISHELRTPVAVMRGELEAVQDGVRKLEKPVIDSLHAEALSLTRIIDDLHTLSMSDVGALDYQMNRVNLATMVREFVSGNVQVLFDHGLQHSVQIDADPIVILGDNQRLEQLLSNLLQNTCRYTDTGGQLEIKLGHDTIDGRVEAVLQWYDSSPGVEASQLPKLFDPLYRTEESRSKEHGGSGLGLSIVQRIVDAHQGNIVASQSDLGGVHLSMRFPTSSIQK